MIRHAARLLALAALCLPLLAAGQEKSGPSISPYGFLLFGAFFNSGPFNNKDNANQVKVPTVADSGGSFVGSARGSRLGFRLDGLDAGLIGGKLGGVLELDFKGGHFGNNSAGWNAFAPRLRLAYARADWKSDAGAFQVLVGQDWGVIGNLNPTTVSYNCDPVFVQSGNLYRRRGWGTTTASAATSSPAPARASTGTSPPRCSSPTSTWA